MRMNLTVILGACLFVLLIIGYITNIHDFFQIVSSLFSSLKGWWFFKVPVKKVLGRIAEDKTEICIFARDFFIAQGTPLMSREGLGGPVGFVPNVYELWPRVEAIGLANIVNTLGKLEKTKNIEIVEMGKDPGVWNKDLIILGAQTQKCFDFYKKMKEVAYKVDSKNIINVLTGKKINRIPGYVYGVILKCKNPFVKGDKGIGFLVGGFGVLGTEATTYYFKEKLDDLGKKFGNKSFGIVIRASVTAGAQSAERIKKYDVIFQ